jgi:hypothetical protein
MARFNVTAPDGSIIPVDAPDGATEQDAIAFAAATFKPAQAPAQTEVPGPRQRPSALAQFGRSAASLADVTIGGILPAVVQQVGYPLARLGRSPEQAQAATARLVGAVESPVGRAFGVTETPEYQQEAGRQLVDFIGQNFQKGAKWIAGKTGLPQSDVENLMGTATVAAPAVARPAARTVQQAAAPVIEKAVIGAKMPFEGRRQAKLERQSLEDYARGPQIDALKDARRMGLLVNPLDIESSVGTNLLTTAAGEKGAKAITSANKNQVRNIALKELDLPPTAQLNGDTAFNQARKQVAGPYEQVKKLPIQQADDAMVQRLEALRADLDVIGAQDYAPAISKIVDDAVSKTQTGLTGEQLLKNISVLRNRAKRTYNNKAATDDALDIADTNLKIATELESMIDGSISNPKLLSEFRDARQKMARSYAYEGATDFNTGVLDVKKLSRITSKNNNLTGDIAALGRIAGNFPEAFTNKVATPFSKALAVGRSGAAGTLGGVAGYAFGQDYVSAAAGTVLGALGGKVGESVAARRIASPGYQAGLNLRDARIPVNQLAASMQPIPQSQAIVPYQAPVEVLGQGQGTYFPNFEMRGEGRAANRVVWDPVTKTYRAEFPPEVTPMAPEAPLNRLGYDPNAPAQGQPGVFDIMRQRERDLSMRQGMAAEAQQAAAEAAARRPTSGAVEMQINPLTGLPEIATGIKGATPATFQDFGTTLKSATDKATAGRMFDLTAAEKVAFDKTRVDLAEAVPGMKALSDKAVAAKMQDRAWVQDAVGKAQERARAFEAIAARADTERARQSALANRERMLDLAEQMEDMLRPARPVKTGGQGPKTRAFQRNMLTPEQEIQNALVK